MNGVRQASISALYDVPAPAKINWFVHVLGRLPDGRHALQTVFQFIDWCDWLDFERRDDGVVRRLGAAELPAEDLCVRAALLLQRTCGSRWGVDIHLRKSVPAQAGLGGGSSDAATTLLALNRLWGLGLSRERLQVLALELGADVPVFVFGRNAFAEGVGEQLRPLELPAWSMLAAWPGAGLSTAAMFAAPQLARDTPAVRESEFVACLAAGGVPAGLAFGRNDLQPVAQAALPELAQMAQWLEARTGAPARMSGSGSACFAPCAFGAGQHGAGGAAPGWVVRECRALAAHPLLAWADAA